MFSSNLVFISFTGSFGVFFLINFVLMPNARGKI